jgi:hypothetical protein
MQDFTSSSKRRERKMGENEEHKVHNERASENAQMREQAAKLIVSSFLMTHWFTYMKGRSGYHATLKALLDTIFANRSLGCSIDYYLLNFVIIY